MLTLVEKAHELNQDLNLAEIEGILFILLKNPNIMSNKLIQMTGLPRETLRRVKASMSFLLENSDNDSINIRKEHIEALEKENLSAYPWSLYQADTAEKLANKLKQLRHAQATFPKRDLDQFYATEETSVAKALILDKFGLLKKTKVALLGDDDLVSVVVSWLDKDFTTTVFDTDQDLLNVIQTEAEQKTQLVNYDAKNDIPQKYRKGFDVVVTDPPYTKTGVNLFLNRAIELLKGKYIFLYFGASVKTPEKSLEVQDVINQMGLVIEHKINNFAQYNGAESIGSSSSLYILKTTPSTHLLPISDLSALYTNQIPTNQKFPYVEQWGFKIKNVSTTLLKSKSGINKALGEFCNTHRFKVVDQKLTKFNNGGMTITFVLSNSNLTVHTWPEYNAIHIDLVVCSAIYNRENLVDTLSKLFGTKNIEARRFE